MAIENTASQIAYVCDGVSTAFPTSWPVLDGESVRVIEEVEDTGAAAELTRNVHFTVQVQGDDPVTGQPGQGLVMPLGAAPAAGRRWHLLRDTRAVQPVQLPTAGQVPSRRVERTIDRQAMVAQESRRDGTKAVRVPDHEVADMALPIARTRAQRMLAFDADGRPTAPGFTTEQVAAVIDQAQLQLLAGAKHGFLSDGATTVWPLPAEWGLIYAAISLTVNIGGIGGQTTAYVLTDGADHGFAGQTVIIFPDPLPEHVPVEVRVPPVAAGQAVNDDTAVLALGSLVPRSLKDRFGQVSNPLDEGADRTGTADSRTAFATCLARGGHIDVPAGLYRIGAAAAGAPALTMDVPGTTLNLLAGAILAFDGVAAASDGLRITSSDSGVIGAGKITSSLFNDAAWGTDGVQAAKLSTSLVRIQTAGADIQNVRVQATLVETNGYGLYINTPAAQSIRNVTLDIQSSRCFVGVQIAGGQAANPGAVVAGVKFVPGSRIVDTANPAPGTYNGALGGNAISILYQVQDIDLSGLIIERPGRMGAEVYTGPTELAAGLMARNVRISKCAIIAAQYRNLSLGGSGITVEDSRIVGYTGGTQARDYIEIAGDTYDLRNLDLTATGVYGPPPSGNYLSRGLAINNVTLRSAANGNGGQVLRALRWAGVTIEDSTVRIAHAVAAGVTKYPAIQINGCINATCEANTVIFSGTADLDYGIEFVRIVGGRIADCRVECLGLANGQIYAPYAIRALGGVTVAGIVTRSNNGATFGAANVTDNSLSGSGLLWRWAYIAGVWTRTACNAAILTAPPGGPVNGTVYVVGDNPTGLWAGQARTFAVTANAGASWTHTAYSDVLLFDHNSPYAGDEAALPRDTGRAYLLSTNGLINVDWVGNDIAQSNTLKGSAGTTGLVLNGNGSPYGLLWNFTYRDNTDVVAITAGEIGIAQRRILAGASPQQASAAGGNLGTAAVPLAITASTVTGTGNAAFGTNTANAHTLYGTISLGNAPGTESLKVVGGAYNRQVVITGGNGADVSINTNTGGMLLGIAGTYSLRVSTGNAGGSYVQISANSTPLIQAAGSDANISLQFATKGTSPLQFSTNTSVEQFRVANTDNAVNRTETTGSTTGNPVRIYANGSDANIDLSLSGRGTGRVRFGTYTAAVTAITGYIEIADASGTVRKLAVIA